MPDLSHFWGNDLTWSPTGDLAVTDIPIVTQQRILRRLLTTSGDYIWARDYGAGLGGFVGQPGVANAIHAAIRGQIFKEPTVSRTPEPVIDLTADQSGTLYVHIRYADKVSGQTETLALTL